MNNHKQSIVGYMTARMLVVQLLLAVTFMDLTHLPLIGPIFRDIAPLTAEAAILPAVLVESFDQDVSADGTTFALTTSVPATSSAFIKVNTGTRKSSAGPTGSTANAGPNIGTAAVRLTDVNEVTVERVNGTTVKMMGEVWRYEGPAGGEHEFIVRERVAVSLTGTSASTFISGVSDVDNVIPFVTGYTVNDAAVGNWEAATIAAHMDDSGNLVVSRNNSGTAGTVYVDVVEFTGSAWTVCHGYSSAHDTTQQTITLNTDSDGQGGAVCDVTDWSTATIIEATMEGDSSETGLSDTLALVRPGGTTNSVVFDVQQDANARNDGEAWMHVLQNDGLVVTRASNANIAEGNGTFGTASWPVGATTTAPLNTLSLEWFSDTSGVGTAHMRGGLHARITAAGTIQHWIHRSGNNVGVEYGVVELSGVNYDTAAVSATTIVSATGAQTALLGVPLTAEHIGGALVITELDSARNVTSITINESGSIDASTDLQNIQLRYDLDTTAPYDCGSESYSGGEAQFGVTDTDGFSGANGDANFADVVAISPTQTLCLYPVFDIGAGAVDGETIDIGIANPSTDVVISSGSVTPSSPVDIVGVSTIRDAELTQFGYHWRNDDGSEIGATSATGGSENTPLLNGASTTPQRLRVGVYNAGTGTTSKQYRLEYTEKVSTCSVATGWSQVGGGGSPAWDLFNSSNITDGNDTTNISVPSGGLTDPVSTFTTPNGGLKDTSAQTGNITIGTQVDDIIGEFDSTTVTNGSAQTISLNNTYDDPIVAVSVRYSRSTETQRTPRVVAKTTTSFDVLIDNFDSTLTGSTQIDYVVLEAGTWEVPQNGGLQIYAGTTSVAAIDTYGQTVPSNPGGTIVSWPTAFDTQPAVFATVSSHNDTQWVFANAYDGVAVANPPTTSGATVFLADNFESNGHGAAETVDLIAFEPGNGTNNSTDFVWQQTGSTIVSTPSTVNFTVAYSSTPAVVLAYHPTNGGTDGGFTMVDTDTPVSATGVTVSVDEDGTAADRGHTGTETASIVSFASANNLVEADPTQVPTFAELEFSIQATTHALEGVGYCFRITDAGTALRNYDFYPEATLNADVTVSSAGSQIATIDAGDSNTYLGGTFVITDNVSSRDVTSITLREFGSIDAATDITSARLRYELDTSLPYDCASESYDGTETLFGVASTFDGPNGTTTFTDTASVDTTSTLCGYMEVSVAAGAINGETIALSIENPSRDVIVSSGSVGPGSVVAFSSSTTVAAAALTQTGYHWRSDNGTEAGASSATGGNENTPITDIAQGATGRLRIAINNAGAAASAGTNVRLEYGLKITTCSAVSGWQRIDDGVAFTMATTSQLIEAADTTDIAPAIGGVTNPNTTLLSPNGGQRESSDETGALVFATTNFVELEYALQLTDQSGFDSTYCFRVTDSGTVIAGYNQYPELTTRPQQDFFVQRGDGFIVGTSQSFTAGVDYTAPASASSAFVRITNSHHTGAGTPAGSNDPPDDTTAYIEVTDLTSSFDIVRPSTAAGDTYVAWEIVEYIGLSGADNEMIVRDVGTVTYGASDLFATGTVASVTDDAAVAVFITGQFNPAVATADTNTALSLSSWSATSSAPVFERGDADGVAARVSYAVVEFTGVNWGVQRVEHTYTAAGTFETAAITPVTAVTQTFLHTQKLSGDEHFNLDDTGHEIYLSGMGTISLELVNTVGTPAEHRSVVWVIENKQTGTGALRVYRTDGTISSGGGDNTSFVLAIGGTIQLSNASIYINNQSTGEGSAHPRAYLGATIASSTDYSLYRSDDGQNQDYRVSVVEWPVAELSIRQNYYRLYVDNDTLEPTDPWPIGAADLGENESMTDLDEPLGLTERVRIRMSLAVNNASLVPGTKSYTLQYGRRVTTCNAVTGWTDVGSPGSGSIWRGYDGAPVDGTTISGVSLLLSVSDQPGTYEEENDSAANPSLVDIGEDIEYDWIVENNGAVQKSSYCFRVVEAGGAQLDGYDFYPTVRTSGYTPVITDWQWFDDEENITPSSALAGVGVTPSNIDVGDTLKLRVAIAEIEGAAGEDIKFNLEYSQYPDFRDGGTILTATTSCTGGTGWCYADGGGVDNEFIPTPVLSGIDSCVAGTGPGCGVHNEKAGIISAFDQAAGGVAEHEFTLQHDAALTNRVYYFRLVDATNGVNLEASSTYPSLLTAGSDFVLTISGPPAGTTTEGVIVDAQATPEFITFPDIPLNTEQESVHRLSVQTNAPNGYQVLLTAAQQLQNSYGDTIAGLTATNTAPSAWGSQCGAGDGCFGYHVGDDTLSGDATRFANDDTYAAIPVGVFDEVMYNPLPSNDVVDVVYRIQIGLDQPAGSYTTALQYIALPVF